MWQQEDRVRVVGVDFSSAVDIRLYEIWLGGSPASSARTRPPSVTGGSFDDRADPAAGQGRGVGGAGQLQAGPADRVDAELAAARSEVERLGETVKEQAVELMAQRTTSRWG